MTTVTAASMKRAIKKAEREKHQKKFATDLRVLGIQGFTQEVIFHHTRKWRFDFAHTFHKVGVEIDGGIHGKKSGHNSAMGILSKMEKINEAQLCGWQVYSFSGDQVQNGSAAMFMQKVIERKEKQL